MPRAERNIWGTQNSQSIYFFPQNLIFDKLSFFLSTRKHVCAWLLSWSFLAARKLFYEFFVDFWLCRLLLASLRLLGVSYSSLGVFCPLPLLLAFFYLYFVFNWPLYFFILDFFDLVHDAVLARPLFQIHLIIVIWIRVFSIIDTNSTHQMIVSLGVNFNKILPNNSFAALLWSNNQQNLIYLVQSLRRVLII